MKAAVLTGAREIKTQEVAYPALEQQGIIVKVKACGVCGSDLHVYKSEGKEGTIFGHEFSGDVVEVGSQVAGITAGMRVTAVGFRPCGQCFGKGKGIAAPIWPFWVISFPGRWRSMSTCPSPLLGAVSFPCPKK